MSSLLIQRVFLSQSCSTSAQCREHNKHTAASHFCGTSIKNELYLNRDWPVEKSEVLLIMYQMTISTKNCSPFHIFAAHAHSFHQSWRCCKVVFIKQYQYITCPAANSTKWKTSTSVILLSTDCIVTTHLVLCIYSSLLHQASISNHISFVLNFIS